MTSPRIHSAFSGPIPARRDAACRLAVIGDIHGHADLFAALLDHARASDCSHLILLGDLIDRGPNSLACLDLAAAARRDFTTTALMGNHEQMLLTGLDFAGTMAGDRALETWCFNGGNHVLNEIFGDDVPEGTEDFVAGIRAALAGPRNDLLNAMKMFHRDGQLLFVHGGVPTDFRAEPSLSSYLSQPLLDTSVYLHQTNTHPLWERRFIHDDPIHSANSTWSDADVLIVHGHTIDAKAQHRDQIAARRLNLDVGSFRYGQAAMAIFDADRVEVVHAKR